MPHFDKSLTVEQAFKTHAGARRVFARFHLGGCSNCAISETETIEQVSEGYGIPLNVLMDDLEKLFDQPALEVGDAVRLPDEIRSKIPQLAGVPELGKVTDFAAGAYTVEFGDVRLQGLAEDFIKAETALGLDPDLVRELTSGSPVRGLPVHERLVGAVPVRELGFTRFPAQIDRAAFPDRREVEQPEIDVLDDAAVGFDPVDEVHDLGLEVGETASRPARRNAPRGTQCRIALEQPNGKLAALLPQLFDQRREDRDEGVGSFGRKDMHMRRLVIVTGLSGAGKSQAMKSFEDFGFACLDNVPPGARSGVRRPGSRQRARHRGAGL